jgi:uncharacterized protein YggE
MRRTTPVLTVAALLALTGCGAAAAATSPASGAPVRTATITTSGTGTVSAAPDVMTIQIGVDTSAAHAAGALAANNTKSAAVQAVLRGDGVAAADIQTSQLTLSSQRGRHNVVSYQVTDVVTATIRSLAKAGTLLDAAVLAAGDAGTLDGVTFSIANENPLLDQARRQAVTAARTDAQQLAAADGMEVVGLRSITDQTEQNQPYPEAYASAGSTSAAVPVQAGTQQTTVQVTTVWTVRS